MENWSKWRFIKVGFLLGIGFMIPQFAVMIFGTVISLVVIPPMVQDAIVTPNSEEIFSGITSNFDSKKLIIIEKYREQPRGNKLIILGSIKNESGKKASSIQLEAELYNNNEFVFECSEYISKSLKPGESENFQINCGCGKNPIPAHDKTDIRVVSASNY